VCNLSFSQTPWTRISPNIQEHTVNKLYCLPGTSQVFGVCDGSTIIKSADAGLTWDVILYPAQMDAGFRCKSVVFTEQSTGFVGGSGLTILKTVNGGNTWTKKFESEPVFGQDAFNDIAFFNNSTGVAVADKGMIIRTTDGGESWDILETGLTVNLQGVKVLNDSTAYAIGFPEQMFKTTDRGLTWFLIDAPSNFPEGYIQDLIFVSETTGFVLLIYFDYSDAFHYIFKTTDGGLTWTESLMDTQVPAYDGCLASYDADHVAFISSTWMYHCKITFTDNGGLTWTEQEEQSLHWYHYALCYTDDHSLIAGGTMGKLSNSVDGGYNWSIINQRQIQNDVLDVQFVTNTTGYLLSESYGGGVPIKVLYKTTNGGLNWNWMSNGGHVYFLDSLNGFMISGSYFEKTTDGGNSWQLVSEIEEVEFLDISDMKFYNQMRGMIAAEETLIRTSDGGLTWQDISPGTHNYGEIEYKTADMVFVTLNNSIILKTPDHGISWQQINVGDFGAANDLLLLNGDTAFLVCSYQGILRSTDACLTWQPMVINSTAQMNYKSISFPDNLNGYVVGKNQNSEGNILLKTMDGGLTWNPIESNTTSGLTRVHFFNKETGLIFGNYGVVLGTTTGGIVSTANINPPITSAPLLFSPNPFTTEIYINQPLSSNSLLVITDVTGRRVLCKTITDTLHSIDTSQLKPGVYTLTIFEKDKRISTSKGIRL